MPDYEGDPKAYPRESLNGPLVGTCLCGSLRVTIFDDELFTRRRGHLCHCLNCRKSGGTFAQANISISVDKVKFEDLNGTLKIYADKATGTGNAVNRHFCGECGCPIAAFATNWPQLVSVKLGIFPRIPDPEFETFGMHRQEWQGRHPGVTIFKEYPMGEVLDGST